MFNDALTTFRTREVVTSTSTMRQALSLLACLQLAAAAAYPQTLKTTELADGSTVGLPPYLVGRRAEPRVDGPERTARRRDSPGSGPAGVQLSAGAGHWRLPASK